MHVSSALLKKGPHCYLRRRTGWHRDTPVEVESAAESLNDDFEEIDSRINVRPMQRAKPSNWRMVSYSLPSRLSLARARVVLFLYGFCLSPCGPKQEQAQVSIHLLNLMTLIRCIPSTVQGVYRHRIPDPPPPLKTPASRSRTKLCMYAPAPGTWASSSSASASSSCPWHTGLRSHSPAWAQDARLGPPVIEITVLIFSLSLPPPPTNPPPLEPSVPNANPKP